MPLRKFIPTLTTGVCVALLAGCAASPPTAPAPQAAPPAQAAPSAPAEADAAAGLEKKFQDTARDYKVVQKDGKTLYCKRERVIGSTIPTLQCMSEAQLRTQVENTEELKGRMRQPKASPCGTSVRGCGT